MAGEKYRGKSGPKKANFVSPETFRAIEDLARRPEIRLDEKYFDYVDRGGVRYYSPKVPSVQGSDTKRSGRCRFGIWMDVARQKLMVDPGTIVYGATTGLNTPIFPTLDGVGLDVVDANGWGQGFSVAGKSSGTLYSVVLFYRVTECGSLIPDGGEESEEDDDINTIQLMSPGELDGIDWEQDEENEGGKGAVIVAEVRFKDGSLGKEIASLRQFLGSDLRPGCYQGDESGDDGDGDGGSGSGGEGSGGGGDGSGSGSSGGDPDPDPDPTGSGSSGEEEDECCPGIPDLDAIVIGVAGDACFDLWEPRPVEVSVHGYVGAIPQTENCKKCNWRLRVEYGIGSQSAAEQIGYGGHNFQHTFSFEAWPCSEYTIWARIRRFGVPTSSNGCEDLTHCQVSKQIKMPPVCGQDGCEEESETTIIPPP